MLKACFFPLWWRHWNVSDFCVVVAITIPRSPKRAVTVGSSSWHILTGSSSVIHSSFFISLQALAWKFYRKKHSSLPPHRRLRQPSKTFEAFMATNTRPCSHNTRVLVFLVRGFRRLFTQVSLLCHFTSWLILSPPLYRATPTLGIERPQINGNGQSDQRRRGLTFTEDECEFQSAEMR